MKNFLVVFVYLVVVGSVYASEKPLAKKFAEVHNILAPLELAAAKGDKDALLVLCDVETSMEHPDYNLPSVRTNKALTGLVVNGHLDQKAKAAINAYGQKDMTCIKWLLVNK
jgi:hypothetical protein